MARITLKGKPIHTVGDLPAKGSAAPGFELVDPDLGAVALKDLAGKKVVLNIFPSIDTPVCQSSTRAFNEKVAGREDAEVLCISRDLPFAFKRFCGAEGIEKVRCLSDFRGGFGDAYGVTIEDGPLQGLLSRAVVVLDGKGKILYTQQVPEIAEEPDYDAAMAALE